MTVLNSPFHKYDSSTDAATNRPCGF